MKTLYITDATHENLKRIKALIEESQGGLKTTFVAILHKLTEKELKELENLQNTEREESQ